MNGKNYQLMHKGDKLIFITPSFRAEKTSVLNTGVYTREFTSMLFASAVCVASYMIIEPLSLGPQVVKYFILVIIFAVSFLAARKYIFKEQYLEVDFDKSSRMVDLVRKGIITRTVERIPFDKIQSVEIGSRKFVPENPDGIDFVQKISSQHGSPLPGLSEVEEFITLSLRLTDESERIIFAAKINGGKVDGEPEVPVTEIRDFLGHHV